MTFIQVLPSAKPFRHDEILPATEVVMHFYEMTANLRN